MLAAGQVPAELVSAHREDRKQVEQSLDGPRCVAPVPAREDQVLADGDRRPDPAALRDEGDAGPHDAVRAGAGQFPFVEADATAGRVDQAHQGVEQCGLAGAVATQDGQGAAGFDVEVDAVEHLALPVPGVQVTDLQ